MSINTWKIWSIFAAAPAEETKRVTDGEVRMKLSRFRLPQDEQDSIARTVHTEEELHVIILELETRKSNELTKRIIQLAFECVGGNVLHPGQAALVCVAHRFQGEGALHTAFASLREELALFEDLRAQAFANAAHAALPEPLLSGYLEFRADAGGQVRVSVMKWEDHVWREKTIFELDGVTVSKDRDFWRPVCKAQANAALLEHNGNNVLNWLAAERWIETV